MNPALKNLLRPHYIDLQGYVSAGMESDKGSEKIFLNANENPYELPGLEGFNRYPEPQPKALAAAYAKAYNISADQIVMTRGADEAIVILTKLFCEPTPYQHPHSSNKHPRAGGDLQPTGDSILICPPTFGMYGVDAKAMPANVVEVPLLKENGTFKLDTQGIIEHVNSNHQPPTTIKLIYICSPNNPTGTSFPHEQIAEICREVEGEAVVILDETYAEFSSAGSMTANLANHPNLIILRTLSKSYALAGMRMGSFLCADTDFIALVKAKALDAYPLPHASVEAALHVLSDDIRPLAQDNIRRLLEERTRLPPLLQESNYVKYIYPSDANFLLIEMDKAAEFVKFAAESNIIIRDFSSKPGTENCIRLSIGTPEQNNLVLTLLDDFAS